MNESPLTKEQILDTAEQVLRRYGPDKTSVVDVARALQVSHGTLYRHFASKNSLREAVTERWLERLIAEPLAQLASSASGSSTMRLRQWLEALVAAKRTSYSDDPEMFAMYASVTLEATDMIHSHIDRLILQAASIIEQGMADGELKPCRPEEAARAVFLATLRFHHPSHVREWSLEHIDQDFDAVWRLILNGLASVEQ